jgi:NADH-quinone oxidoreductase subunit C
MTATANLNELAAVTGARVDASGTCLFVSLDKLAEAAACLKEPAGGEFEYLDMITAADYPQGFELVYRLLSLKNNQSVTLKTRVSKHDPRAPSLVSLWKGADFQEREVYDLFGITFTGHPCLRRIMLWETFEGHPLRKDFNCRA